MLPKICGVRSGDGSKVPGQIDNLVGHRPLKVMGCLSAGHCDSWDRQRKEVLGPCRTPCLVQLLVKVCLGQARTDI